MTIMLERPVTEPVCLKETVEDLKLVLAVARGAALLDQLRPGWEQKVDLLRLDMQNPHQCVVGQLEGSFWKSKVREVQDPSYGFFTDTEECPAAQREYAALTQLWTQVILEKRAAVAA